MIQILAISVLASLCLATYPASETRFTLYEKFELAVRPCALGGELCESENLDLDREAIFQDNYDKIREDSEGGAPDLKTLSPVLDWRSELLARLKSGVTYSGSRTESIPVTPLQSSFEVTNPLLDLSFDINHQPDEKAVECRPPDAEHAGRVCNYSWAFALKALMDSAYHRSTGEDHRFSFDFIRHCLFDVEEQCEMKRPIDMLLDVIEGTAFIPFEDDFDYGGADSCSTYTRELAYGGEFVVHTPERSNRGGLMNLVVDYPTMVLVSVSLESLQIRGSGVRFSLDPNLRPNAASGWLPNLYGVMSGYVEYAVPVDGDSSGMWFVDTRPMWCFEAMLNLPMRASESNGNYAGIAAYAVGLSFKRRRNELVGASHEFFSMFDAATSSLKFPEDFCSAQRISYERLDDFDYLNDVEFHPSCQFSSGPGGVDDVDGPPSWLRALRMVGGCVRDGSTLRCADMLHVTRIELDCNSNCDGVESFSFDALPRMRHVVLRKDDDKAGPSIGKSLDFSAAQQPLVTSLSILGSFWFPGMHTLDMEGFTNLRHLAIRGHSSFTDTWRLHMSGLRRLERVTIAGCESMRWLALIDMSGSFRKGYDTTLSFLNGAGPSISPSYGWMVDDDTHLFRMLIAGRDENGFQSLNSLHVLSFSGPTALRHLRGFYFNADDQTATPESTFAHRHTALFKGDDDKRNLSVVQFENAKFQEVIIDSSLTQVYVLELLSLTNLRRLEITGSSFQRSYPSRIDLAGSFDAEDDSTEIFLHDGTMRVNVDNDYRGSTQITTGGATRLHVKNFKIHRVDTMSFKDMSRMKSMEFENADIHCYWLDISGAPGLREFIVRGDGSMGSCAALALRNSFTGASEMEIEEGIQIPPASAANDKVFAGVESVQYCQNPMSNKKAGEKIVRSIQDMYPGKQISTGEPEGC